MKPFLFVMPLYNVFTLYNLNIILTPYHRITNHLNSDIMLMLSVFCCYCTFFSFSYKKSFKLILGQISADSGHGFTIMLYHVS